jgi:hypothetical protein
MIEIHEGVGGPETVAQRLPRDDLSRALQKLRENPKGLLLQLDLQPLPPQFPGTQIDFEYSEPNYVASVFAWHRRL